NSCILKPVNATRMKNQLILILSMLTWMATGCQGNSDNKAPGDVIPGSSTSNKSELDPGGPITEKKFEGKGVTFIVREDKSLGVSVSRITIIATDSTHTDSLNLGDKDPVQAGMLADLDENGQDELYLVTTSVGSGSYAHISGFMRDEQNKLVAIEVPEVSPDDQARGRRFEGYMGHDTLYIHKNKLIRKFPKYHPGDPNDKPTGGDIEIRYALVGSRLEPE
ncbi:MAG TPA: hypothetical protein VLC28_16565, partial [Flavitalea sp.]|nr:hypothetical protein [Flavitalea sp.]